MTVSPETKTDERIALSVAVWLEVLKIILEPAALPLLKTL